MQVEIISTGDEVITGFITDTNVSYLCQELLSLGIQVKRRHTVGDKLEDIQELIEERSKECDVLLVNGGLGPTSDDNTTEAAARAAGVKQVLNETWLEKLKMWHQERNRPFVKNNLKQAMLPEGAVMLDNPYGTACGFALKINRARCFFTPGVPSEFKHMYQDEIKPRLIKDFCQSDATKVKRLFLFGISESRLGALMQELSIPQNIIPGYRAAYPLMELKLIAHNASDESLDETLQLVRPVIKNYLICEDTFDLPERIAKLSGDAGFTLFDNQTKGEFVVALASGAKVNAAFLSAFELDGNIRQILTNDDSRYFMTIRRCPEQDKTFFLELVDTDTGAVRQSRYTLEVTLKDKRASAIALLALDFLLKTLQDQDPIHPDGCTRYDLPKGEIACL